MNYISENKNIIYAAVLILIISIFSWLLISRANLKAELSQVTANNILCIESNKGFAESLTKQAKALEQIKQISNEQKINNEKNNSKIKTLRKEIENLKNTSLKGEACTSANELINNYIGAIK